MSGGSLYSILLVATWVIIGLIVYWARRDSRPPERYWLGIYALAGPLMLPWMVWQSNLKYYREQRYRRQRQSGPKAVATPAPDPVRGVNPKKLRKKNGGMGPRKR